MGTRGACGRVQLARLFRVVLILQAEKFPNARELAERCEVSRRTIYRDLDLLTEAGIPVRYRVEKQGYQLAKGFFLPPTELDEAETLALLILAQQRRVCDGLAPLHHAWGGAAKLVQALPAEIREHVTAAAEPFLTGARRGVSPPDRRLVQETIVSALARLRQIRVWYRVSDGQADECTKFSLYRLVLRDDHWFMIGRSSLRRGIEVIGVPWVRRVVMTDDPYTIPPRFNLGRFLGQAWGVDRDPVRYRVGLRFSSRVAPELNDVIRHHTQKRTELADGRVELHFVLDGIEEVLRWVLGFGDQVEVLEPLDLRRRVFQVASSLARRHRPGRPTNTPSRVERATQS